MTVRGALLLGLVAIVAIVLGLPPALDALGLGPDPSLLPKRGRIQPIGGARALHLHLHGSGAPVVLVHGVPSAASDWEELPTQLAEQRLGVVVYDRIGYGYSTRGDPDDPDDYTYASNARDLGALLDALRLERAALVGWSYGGAVAQTFAAAQPERVSHLVLVGAVGPASDQHEEPPFGAVGALITTGWGQAVLRWIARVPPLARAVTKGPLTLAFSGEANVPEGWHDYTAALLARPGTFEAWLAEVERNDPSALHPEQLPMPALVVHGTDDRLVDYAVAEDLAKRLPHAKLVPIFEGGHMLPVTHTERLAEEIARFVAP